MPSLNLDDSSQLLFVPGLAASWLVINNDVADTMYIAPQKPVHNTDIPVPPQASVVLDGSRAWYGSTLTQTTMVSALTLPGGQEWQNPVGVQIALDTLGLAKDTSVNAPAYGPTKDATLTGGMTLAQPAVPGMLFASAVNKGPGDSLATIVNPAADYRIWSVWISYTIASTSGFTPGLEQFFASVEDPTGTELIGIELELIEASALANDTIALTMPGVPFSGLDTVLLNINGGVGPAGTSQRCSGGVMYSIP